MEANKDNAAAEAEDLELQKALELSMAEQTNTESPITNITLPQNNTSIPTHIQSPTQPINFMDFAILEKLVPRPSRSKMVLVVRMDLKMGVGKIAAQCGHASVGIYQDLLHSKRQYERKLLKDWEENASPKIALKVPDFEEMMKLQSKAASLSLPTHIVLDAGRTQVAPGSATVLSILGPAEIVDQVTGHLKLL